MQRAIFTLTPAEGKRLIAKGVRHLPEVGKAFRQGKIIIAGGTTNAYVAEELLGIEVSKVRYTAGIITKGETGVTPRESRIKPFVIVKGEVVDENWEDVLDDFGPDDVFIKGANAVDATGMAGVLVAHPQGGTIGRALGVLAARGSHLVVPVGLEKMIPSVSLAARNCGIMRFQHSLGMPVGLIPLVQGKVVTELVALEILASVEAVALGAGGVGGSEGSVVIAVSGDADDVERVFNLVKEIKGEPPVQGIG
ncbi:MAG: Uncharacterized protein XD63_0988 [Thermoanaerobacterales bacterium 50_218]|nr:MAG: Uncharacterized protein XD63_0988 [Thermoanaerobacterales bacterium 50_218]HAA90060.1 hypothetical protein [Peptococcaceae bacterium]